MDEERAAQLRQMKRRATGLLVVVSGVFVVLAVQPSQAAWVGYAVATAEGSMVGGLADWFAVTALFRHPLGIPIPHTAIVRRRKDQFAETLGAFVRDNFLSPGIVAERIRAAHVARRTARWLSEAGTSERVAAAAVDGLVAVVDLVGDDDLHRLLHAEIDQAVRSVPFGRVAGRALTAAVGEQRHRPLVDAGLRAAVAMLDEQREPLRQRFAESSPWWLPGPLEGRVFDGLVDGVRRLLDSVAEDPEHELRATVDHRLLQLAQRLEHDPVTAAKVDELVTGVLEHPEVRGWTRTVWTDLSKALHEQRDDPGSRLRTRVTEAVLAVGHRLAEDTVLQERITAAAESAVRSAVERHRGEISSLVSATMAAWDADETSTRLELLLGRDLQFIRINGTVVGGLAGFVLHTVADALGRA
ncbi:MAG: DUF445 domain-containing protein [Actinomycetota bacterium]|nr:DUF445 domain-containing protein [Actinomycetota bacterium]